jgi:hypothetical protein
MTFEYANPKLLDAAWAVTTDTGHYHFDQYNRAPKRGVAKRKFRKWLDVQSPWARRAPIVRRNDIAIIRLIKGGIKNGDNGAAGILIGWMVPTLDRRSQVKLHNGSGTRCMGQSRWSLVSL